MHPPPPPGHLQKYMLSAAAASTSLQWELEIFEVQHLQPGDALLHLGLHGLVLLHTTLTHCLGIYA
jgi:hypothetical protein